MVLQKTKTYGRGKLGQPDAPQTVPLNDPDPMAVGPGEVVGHVAPMGTPPNIMWVLRPTPQVCFVQMCLAFCPTWFSVWTEWLQWWNNLVGPAQRWLHTAHKKWLCARLLIPHSLRHAFQQKERYKLRANVGFFQFHTTQGVQGLRQKLAEPTPEQPASLLWIKRFIPLRSPLLETVRDLRDQVGAPRGTTRKRKRETLTMQLQIDANI